MQKSKDQNEFIRFMSEWLEDNGLLASDYARYAGCDKSYVSKFLNGNSNVTVSVVCSFHEFTELSDVQLLSQTRCNREVKLKPNRGTNRDNLFNMAMLLPPDLERDIIDLWDLVGQQIREIIYSAKQENTTRESNSNASYFVDGQHKNRIADID